MHTGIIREEIEGCAEGDNSSCQYWIMNLLARLPWRLSSGALVSGVGVVVAPVSEKAKAPGLWFNAPASDYFHSAFFYLFISVFHKSLEKLQLDFQGMQCPAEL